MTDPLEDRFARLRWGVYCVLIAIAVGNMMGRLLNVNAVDKAQLEAFRINERLSSERQKLAEQGLTDAQVNDKMADVEARLRNELKLQRPFLSANDRSRWMTIRSLVEHGTYEIDAILEEPAWDTIDMVQHRGRDGELHLYSSKPPILATLLAGEYWLIHRLTGATLGDHPYEIGRVMLVTVNILPLVLMYVLLARLVERFGTSDWGRIFVMAGATMGTFLNTFAVVLNNHIVGAVSAAVSHLLRSAHHRRRRTSLAILSAGRPGRRIHRGQRAPRAFVFRTRWTAATMARAAGNTHRFRARGRRDCGGFLRYELDRP